MTFKYPWKKKKHTYDVTLSLKSLINFVLSLSVAKKRSSFHHWQENSGCPGNVGKRGQKWQGIQSNKGCDGGLFILNGWHHYKSSFPSLTHWLTDWLGNWLTHWLTGSSERTETTSAVHFSLLAPPYLFIPLPFIYSFPLTPSTIPPQPANIATSG